jgi:hypothetical protein
MSFQISAEILLNMFKPKLHYSYEVIENPIPEDGKIIGIYVPSYQNVVSLRIESESFPEIDAGSIIREMDITTIKTRITEDKLHAMIDAWKNFWTSKNKDLWGIWNYDSAAAKKLCELAGIEY